MRPKPRVRNKTKHPCVVTTVTPEITRHSPRNGFTVSFVLFPVTSLFDTVICASSRRLDASIGASEPHDFAVRVSAIRQRHHRVHRIPPRVRDVRTPLFWDGTMRLSELICLRLKQKYFCKRGWTGHFGKHEVICPSGSFVDPKGFFSSFRGVGNGNLDHIPPRPFGFRPAPGVPRLHKSVFL